MIPILFNILFFIIPLIFYKGTSELFEFNKIVALYIFTALIVSAWVIQSIRVKEFIFKKTILDIPLTLYLLTLLFSTLFSIDPRTSVFGYYSRFNGGLISQICYALLYWAFVSNINKEKATKAIFYSIAGTVVASLLAILEHFGLFTTCGLMGFGYKESCWVQDVQSRVFSTLGQPNWLAALIVALIPLTYRRSYKYYLVSLIFFVTLLFTKSRSGLLAFGVESLVFWGFIFWKDKFKYIKEFLIINVVFIALFFVFQSPFKTNRNTVQTPKTTGPVLETGGTESGTIRKYVWLGAFEVFKHYPILGTGPETFAFSFPMFKPVGHNLTSEWDFIYNKAHNEFLNYLANTGLIGIIIYLILVGFSIYQIYKSNNYALLAGYLSILITNFFGFSVVPVSLLFFIFPALAFVLNYEDKSHYNKVKFTTSKQLLVLTVLAITAYLIYLTVSYWKADIYYNNAKSFNRSGDYKSAINEASKALSISKGEALYFSELALANSQVDTAMTAYDLSHLNQNSRKILINNLVKNSGESPDNLLIAEKVILDGINKSPNDPKLYYQLGILQLKIGKNNTAIQNLEKTIELKSNYKEGRFALGSIYKALNENEKSKEQFEYILKNIDPNDELTKKYLDEINSKMI